MAATEGRVDELIGGVKIGVFWGVGASWGCFFLMPTLATGGKESMGDWSETSLGLPNALRTLLFEYPSSFAAIESFKDSRKIDTTPEANEIRTIALVALAILLQSFQASGDQDGHVHKRRTVCTLGRLLVRLGWIVCVQQAANPLAIRLQCRSRPKRKERGRAVLIVFT
jgi:hypothetical protein